MNPMRLEYKYLIRTSELQNLRNDLSPFVNLDEYAEKMEEKEYTVRSIYYDSMRLDDYQDKLAGLQIRKKLRIRGYNKVEDNSLVFLEVKRKYENFISKNRAPVLYHDLDEILITSDINRLLVNKKNYLNAQNDALQFFYILKAKNYVPVTLVVYDREAFYSKHDLTLRITFDKNLRSKSLVKTSELFNETGLKYAMPGYFILEIKFFGGFPKWLQNILSKYELNRQAVSKYVSCVDNHSELRKFVYDKKLLIPSPFASEKTKNLKEQLKNAG